MQVTDWFPSLTTANPSGWAAASFSEAYKRKFCSQPPCPDAPLDAALAWAACEALVAGVESAGSVDPYEVAMAISFLDISTMYGRLRFDSNGQAFKDRLVWQY